MYDIVGTVEGFMRDEDLEEYYLIRYDDGIEEDLDRDEMLNGVDQYQRFIHCDPSGWRKQIVDRKDQTKHTKYDRMFVTPRIKYKLKSRADVQKFIAALKVVDGDEKKASKLYRKIKIAQTS